MPRRGPLSPAGELPAGRQLQISASAEDRDQLHREAEESGSTVSDLIRERADAAAQATPAVRRSGERAWISARLSQERLAAVELAAAAAGLGPTAWLRLVSSQSGRVLLAQLQAAHGGT